MSNFFGSQQGQGSCAPSSVDNTLGAAKTPHRKQFISRLSLAGTSTRFHRVDEAETVNHSCENVFSIQDSSSRDHPSTVIRHKVKKTLDMFRELSDQILKKHQVEHERMSSRTKVQIDAVVSLQKRHKSINDRKQLGAVPGIEVGDHFNWRAELTVIGLHHQFSSGIDYMKINGNVMATSIVVSGRYANRKSSDSLVYIGHGGNPRVCGVKPTDQKMERGNLALFNSMNAKSPVRVIFKVFTSNKNFIYVYDGLYQVDKMTQERGEFGKLEFKFFLNRISGQPETFTLWEHESKSFTTRKGAACLNDNLLQPSRTTSRKSNKWKTRIARRNVICVNDISQGQEVFPIRVVTSRNDGLKLPPFDYIVKIEYPNWFKQSMPPGCGCIGSCQDHEKCSCAIKNGGVMPYVLNKKLIACGKPLIYECGPSCKCSASCINRVSQRGIQFKLEIFQTDLKCWGVRTRSFIPSGSFVCEYIGEVISNKEAELRQVADDCLLEIGNGNGVIDATRRGNIARFITHSRTPNLCVKDILYDDKRFTHKILFAVKDIPGGRELTYNHWKKKSRKGSKVENQSCHKLVSMN